ncbi:phycobilisome rod-core linker polypeptide [Geitlerinema sp. PCC 9228]|uniref:phycobilisome rod-core linker polypeptide n=1 Tax=Geitlerinema sp. PCC 9228 TaxID=111611 RepID=UPI0008F99BE9|nr:phycobilisome rod-core linker polypeptide [Geitlerinema sp. PCC 9228]
MAIPLLEYSPKSQNERVSGYEVPGEEQPKIYDMVDVTSNEDMEELIWAAYRQIFSEHQLLKSNRQSILESQLKYKQITVRDFIRGLVTSEVFRERNYNTNNNYRFVAMCVQRVLGREVYNEREKIAWSIVLATKGMKGFVDALLDSDEYMQNFGDNIVPFQRRRILPQRDRGETPFNLKTPRYGAYHRAQLGFPQIVWQNAVRTFRPQEKQPQAGDPVSYLGMAREIRPRENPIPRVSAQNIDYLSKVPRK